MKNPGNATGIVGHLVAPYCAIPQDYLSDTHLLRAMGFWCLNMANPLLRFWAFPPWRACEVEVRYPPPRKGVSQRCLRETLWKQGKRLGYPPLRYYLERVLRDMGRHAYEQKRVDWQLFVLVLLAPGLIFTTVWDTPRKEKLPNDLCPHQAPYYYFRGFYLLGGSKKLSKLG